ncbi:MAG: hypothetical protein JNL90_10205 [Planctomycetes bacterium]|nr:hypothetical protein [Planctomycetota bacterium]
MIRPLLALAFAVVTAGTLSANAPRTAGLAAARGLVIEQSARQGERLALRLRADRDLSAVRGIAVLTTLDASGQRREVARASLETAPLDRSPRRRARRATVAFTLPADAPAQLEVDLLPGR